MYRTGLDPMTMKPVYVAKGLRDRKVQRAMMQFFKPENYFTVRRALIEAGRADLIGDGCDCLISPTPPQAAIEARRRRTKLEPTEGDYVHSHGRALTVGYRPHRESARRRHRPQSKQ